MNRKDAKALLHIIAAFADGEAIQTKNHLNEWCDANNTLKFTGHPDRYRIKPKEMKVTRYGIVARDNGEFLTSLPTKVEADNYVARSGDRLVVVQLVGSYER